MTQQERGVSPVISTILMVAIVVILAATISVFVLGFGENISDSGPTASFDTEQRGNPVVLTHISGDTIQTANLNIKGAATWSTSNEELTAGDRITIIPDSGAENIVVTWTQGDTSAILTSITIDGSNLIINPSFAAGSGTDADF